MQRATCTFNARTQGLDVCCRSLPLLTEMADGFTDPCYELSFYCGPSPFFPLSNSALEVLCYAFHFPSMPTECLDLF